MREGRNDATLIESLITHPNAPQAADALEALGSLDDAFLQKARLGIMSTLLALGEADFKLLKEALSLSDGNLSTHLAVLRRARLRRHPQGVRTPQAAHDLFADAGRARGIPPLPSGPGAHHPRGGRRPALRRERVDAAEHGIPDATSNSLNGGKA